MTSAVSLRGIGKRYRIFPNRQEQLKDFLGFGGKRRDHDFWALKDINLEVEPGVTLGILGRNGAGKSTLLRIISGVIQPSDGTVEINGRLAALFGVGAGFNVEFTGRENVMLNGLLLGIERGEILARFDDIEAFADIGEFMDQPVKTYSSGMRARLGFAVAVNVEPDVLIIDETLSVGDAVFKQIALQRMRDLCDSGTTVLFVSHSIGMVKSFCQKAVLLHKGEMLASGETGEVADRYEALVSNIKAQKRAVLTEEDRQLEHEIDHEEEEDVALLNEEPAEPTFRKDPRLSGKQSRSLRHGSGEARTRNVEVLDDLGRPTEKVVLGSRVRVRAHLEYLQAVEGGALRIIVRNKAGLDVFSTDTALEKTPLGPREAGERLVVDFAFDVPLKPGVYNVTAALCHPHDKKSFVDWIDVATMFEIERAGGQRGVQGMVHLPADVEIHTPEDGADGEVREDRSA